MEYQHATAEHHRQFLTGRLAALEQEHFGLALLLDGAPEDDPQRVGWRAQLEATERNIASLRKGLAQLDDATEVVPPAQAAKRATRARRPRG